MTNPSLKHAKVSAKADGIDSTLVRPSDWNEEHVLTVRTAKYLGQDSSGDGPVQEFPIDYDATGDDFTMMTSAQVAKAIAAAIAALPPAGETGDLYASMASSRTSCLLLNGQTIGNAGSGATYASVNALALFSLLWALNSNTWPVNGGRGVSAAADWTALKTLAVPDARGCVIGMLDLSAGINALIVNLGVKVGEQNHLLITAEMPAHTHVAGNGTGGAGSGGGSGFSFSNPPGVSGATGGDTAHNNVQPTLGANIFIRL